MIIIRTQGDAELPTELIHTASIIINYDKSGDSCFVKNRASASLPQFLQVDELQLQLTQICEDRATKIHPDDTYLEHIKRYWYLNHYGEISEVSHPNIYEFRKAVELGNAYYNRASALEAKEELKRRLT